MTEKQSRFDQLKKIAGERPMQILLWATTVSMTIATTVYLARQIKAWAPPLYYAAKEKLRKKEKKS